MTEKVATLPRYAFDQTGAIYGPVDAGPGTFVRHEDLEAAEVAVGTLQTALRQLIDALRLPRVCVHDAEPDYCDGCRYDTEKRTAAAVEHALALLPALEPTPVDKPHVDICRTPFEAFGHNELCGRWVEGPESISLDSQRPCTCGGVELHPDGPALEPTP